MSRHYAKLQNIVDEIRRITDFEPTVAVVLGSGLGDFANEIDKVAEIKYTSLTNFPVSTVSGHEGKFVFGRVGKTNVVCMQGRVHLYEGYEPNEVVLPIRVMKMLGAKTLILTNAAGGINSKFSVGDFMQITGHISSFVPSPLIGENIDELGDRFPDMSSVYSKDLVEYISSIASNLNVPIKRGVYLQTTGPNYETPEEIGMYQILGADAVGMSTAIEAMVAKSMGMKVAGISLITNLAAGLGGLLSHEEVKQVATEKTEIFKKFLYEILQNIQ